MEEDILQVSDFETMSRLPNDLHIGLATTQKELMANEYTVDNPAPGKLAGAITAFNGKVDLENASYLISRASDLTAQIQEQDTIRDMNQGQLKTLADAYKKMSALPQMQQAAVVFLALWDKYSPDAKAAYEVQTTSLSQWYEEFQQTPDAVAAATTLGLDSIIADMMQANGEVHRLYLLRDEQQGQQQLSTKPLKDARQETDKAYKWMIALQNAYALVDAHPERFNTIITNLTRQQDNYRQLYDDRQRTNKRVRVESDIVGNHYYYVTSGWTWAKVVSENAKALALDPEPSAPGVEPVVTAQRVVSLDKKAVKAGGLAVALAGVIVKPSDEVDAGKTYELVGYAAE